MRGFGINNNRKIDKDNPSRLFVYGIFLRQSMRDRYGMSGPLYDTVPDFVTVGGYIVQAVSVPKAAGCALTGLVVDVDPQYWEELDALESGYDRIKVLTTSKQEAWMYAAKGSSPKENNNDRPR